MIVTSQQRRPEQLVESEVIAPSAARPRDWDSINLLPNPLPGFPRNAVDMSLRVFDRDIAIPVMLQIERADQLDAVRLFAASEHHDAYLLNLGDVASTMTDRSTFSRLVTICDAFERSALLAELRISHLLQRGGGDRISAAALTSAVKNLRLSGLIVCLDFVEAARHGQADLDPSITTELIAELRPIVRCPVLVRARCGFPRSVARRLRESGAMGFITGGSGADTAPESIPTTAAIRILRGLGVPVISDGPYVDGNSAAKAIALGADLVAPRNVLKSESAQSPEDLDRWIEKFALNLTESMFAIGARTLGHLRQAPFVATGQTREWLEAAETLWRDDNSTD